jgi:hypothetical protein
MQYKTIILELLKQRPEMREQLRKSRQLLPAMELYARELKRSHEGWKEVLCQLRPGSAVSRITSDALDVAIRELEDHLPSGSPMNEKEVLSLEEAMGFLRNRASRR